jgi:hypothetical protein
MGVVASAVVALVFGIGVIYLSFGSSLNKHVFAPRRPLASRRNCSVSSLSLSVPFDPVDLSENQLITVQTYLARIVGL